MNVNYPTNSSIEGMLKVTERIGGLDAHVAMLLEATREQAELLRQHMLREEATTRELIRRLEKLEQNISRWHGVAFGVGLVVSAIWAIILVIAEKVWG